MAYNYSKLLGKIIEKYGTRGKFAEKMGFSERTLSQKLNASIDFKQSEMEKAAYLLGFELAEIPLYFFTS